jgi:hypothetical protein
VIAISYWKRLYRWIANSTLNNGIDDPLLVLTSTPCSQIAWNRLIYLDQASLLVDNVELVLVNQLMVTSTKLPDGLVMLVHERNMTVSP